MEIQFVRNLIILITTLKNVFLEYNLESFSFISQIFSEKIRSFRPTKFMHRYHSNAEIQDRHVDWVYLFLKFYRQRSKNNIKILLTPIYTTVLRRQRTKRVKCERRMDFRLRPGYKICFTGRNPTHILLQDIS